MAVRRELVYDKRAAARRGQAHAKKKKIELIKII